MTSFVLAVLALGVAGIDPLGALLIGGALAAGATRTGALLFTVTSAVVTIAVGCGASLLLGPLIARIDLDLSGIPDTAWVGVNLVLVVVLVLWGVHRARPGSPVGQRPRRPARAVSTGALLVTGAVFALSALSDPAYYAVIALAGRGEPIWAVVVGHTLWFLVSQFPLIVLTAAAAFGAHRRLVGHVHRLWARIKPAIGRLVTGTIFLTATVLSADTAWYLTSGHFLIG